VLAHVTPAEFPLLVALLSLGLGVGIGVGVSLALRRFVRR
jgi:hypothetical protein